MSYVQFTDYFTQDYPTLLALKERLYEQINIINNFKRLNYNPYLQTYKSSWKNTQISVRGTTIIHNFHHYHDVRIFKIPRLTHLMSHYQENLLKIYCINSLKKKSQSITKPYKPCTFLQIPSPNLYLPSSFMKRVSFLLN